MHARERMEKAGLRILDASRTELYLAMPFLGGALDALSWEMDLSTARVGTDAHAIRFHPSFLFRLWVEEPQRLNRTYMHMLVHCLLRHMFGAKQREDAALWDISADIAAEAVIDSMEVPAVARITSDYRLSWYERLNAALPVLSAERIYRFLLENRPDPEEEKKLAREFVACDHSFWERMEDESGEKRQPDPAMLAEVQNRWKEEANRVLVEMAAAGRERAEETGSFGRMLRLSCEERRDYRNFLKRFAVIREEVRIDPDSFDYGLYQYGLSLYGNMPLIEENEFRQAKRVEELVIAIDTSASCQGEHIQRFLNETARILAQQETFFHRVNIRILECDDQVQRDVAIDDVRRIGEYADGFQVSGGYGTDFRPVFRHVEHLRRAGELAHLRGLIYFTDGRGVYPEKPTPYTTAFLFCEEEDYRDAGVPLWAEKIYMKDEAG